MHHACAIVLRACGHLWRMQVPAIAECLSVEIPYLVAQRARLCAWVCVLALIAHTDTNTRACK